MRYVSSCWGTPFSHSHPYILISTIHTLLSRLLFGWWTSWILLWHRWRHRIWSYNSMPPTVVENWWQCLSRLTLQTSSFYHLFMFLSMCRSTLLLDATRLSWDLQTTQSYTWETENMPSPPSTAIITAAHSTPPSENFPVLGMREQ